MSQLLTCLSERSTTGLRSQARASESEALSKAAGERKPIEFSVQALRDESESTAGDSVQATGMVGVDIYGIYSARRLAASREADQRQIQGELDRQSVMFNGYLSLVRIELMRQQIKLMQETEKSLDKNLAEYRKRPQLSGEQEASRTIFSVALQGLRQQRILTEQDEHSLVHDWEIQIQEPFSPSAANLPKLPTRWPNLSGTERSEKSLELRQISALQSWSEAQAQLLKIEKKPLLQLGPSFEWNRISGQEGFRYGLTLQAPLTILSNFSGTTQLAERGMQRATVEAITKKREAIGELEHTKDIYASSVAALQISESPEKTWERMASINKLFLRGLVSGTSLVEAMRQAMTTMQTQHELVIRAMTSLCKIKMAEGKAEECWQ